MRGTLSPSTVRGGRHIAPFESLSPPQEGADPCRWSGVALGSTGPHRLLRRPEPEAGTHKHTSIDHDRTVLPRSAEFRRQRLRRRSTLGSRDEAANAPVCQCRDDDAASEHGDPLRELQRAKRRQSGRDKAPSALVPIQPRGRLGIQYIERNGKNPLTAPGHSRSRSSSRRRACPLDRRRWTAPRLRPISSATSATVRSARSTSRITCL
ncbi:MAG: hypothetical protein ACI8Y8_002661 [Planctomycetota bacterium]|jgi:hypothetical protein